jgi:recombinational DNA repair protein RecT
VFHPTKKTVFRRLAKWLPLASERFERAVEMDNAEYVDGEVVAANEAATSELTSVKDRVASKRRMPITDVAPVQVPPEEPPVGEPPAEMDATA